jgi:hypothetical protein
MCNREIIRFTFARSPSIVMWTKLLKQARVRGGYRI